MKKTALITGGGRGIGKALAVRAAELNYNLALAARTLSELESVAGICAELGSEVKIYQTDLSRPDEVNELFKRFSTDFCTLDLLINNAGKIVCKPFLETSIDEWNDSIAVNLTAPFILCFHAFKQMKKQQSGTIINIASRLGLTAYENWSAYAASKHGLIGLAKVLAAEGLEHGIRIHSICPGRVNVERVIKEHPEFKKELMIEADDIADAMEYLLQLPPQINVDFISVRTADEKPVW